MLVCDVPVMTGTGTTTACAGALVAHLEQEVSEVLTVLRLAGLRSLPVVEDGVVLGTVTERDLIGALARGDVDIGDDVRRRLARHQGLGRWVVSVCDGEVVMTGPEPDPVERGAVMSTTGSVIGVRDVRFVGCRTREPSP